MPDSNEHKVNKVSSTRSMEYLPCIEYADERNVAGSFTCAASRSRIISCLLGPPWLRQCVAELGMKAMVKAFHPHFNALSLWSAHNEVDRQ